MKVSIITGSNSRKAGGLFTSVRRLSQNLQALPDLKVDVMAHNDEYTAVDIAEWSPIKPIAYSVMGPHSFGFSPNLKQLLKDASPHIVHTQGLWMYLSYVSNEWCKRAKVPYLITPRGMLDEWAVGNSAWKKRLTGLMYENSHLQSASCIHALCESEVQSIRAYGLENPICLIPNAIDLPALAPALDDPPWKDVVKPKSKVLLYLGRIHPKKGLLAMIEAFSLLEQSTTNQWELVIAGWDQNNHEDYLKTKAEKLAQRKNIHFIGPQYGKGKELCYTYADAFILPSLSEGLPMVILEAWAYNLPVLMTSACNLPEGFDNKAALQIEPTVDCITEALSTLCAMDDEEIARMGRNGRQLIERKFTWDKVASQISDVYNWLLDGGPTPETIKLK